MAGETQAEQRRKWREQARRRYWANPEHSREIEREKSRRRRDMPAYRDYQAKWLEDHPDYKREWHARKRAEKLAQQQQDEQQAS